MILVTNRQTICTGSQHEFADARVQFERHGHVKIAGLVDRRFLSEVLDAVDRATFYERVHEGIGVELCASAGALSAALELAFNDPVLLELTRRLTGCQPIGCFEGRVYRMIAGTGHYDSWHSDVGEDRLIAMSVNLGREPLEGGVLQIRRADAPEIVSEVENPFPGDAVLFRIDPMYRHRVGPVHGRGARTAYAGWFRSRPDYGVLLRDRLSIAPAEP